jgi:hypothetical protein
VHEPSLAACVLGLGLGFGLGSSDLPQILLSQPLGLGLTKGTAREGRGGEVIGGVRGDGRREVMGREVESGEGRRCEVR